MPARPFSPSEITLIESHLLLHNHYRDRMLVIASAQVGYRVTELPLGRSGRFWAGIGTS